MSKRSLRAYERNPNWSVQYENGLLLLTGGADEIFAIDSVSKNTADEILTLLESERLDPVGLSAPASDIFEQLKTAQIIRIPLSLDRKPVVSIRFEGEPVPRLTAAIKRETASFASISNRDEADLVVIVRTNARLRDLTSGDYPELLTPHLLVDLAYEHTVSLGPLVFKGETACLGCLVGRLTTYWGDADPPVRPRILENTQLTAGLIALQIRKIVIDQARELVQHTVAYDFKEHNVRRSSVYKLPVCPICSISTMDSVGAIALPWIKK